MFNGFSKTDELFQWFIGGAILALCLGILLFLRNAGQAMMERSKCDCQEVQVVEE